MMPAEKEDNLRNLIIEKAAEQFFNYGFANTTTQQIAAALEISKKTLYKYFTSKEELLLAVLDLHDREVEQKIQTAINDTRLDFLEKLKAVTKAIGVYKTRFTPQFIRDLEKVDRSHWKNKESGYRRFVPYVEKLLAEGVRKGMIRNDIDPLMIMQIVSSAFENMLCMEALSRSPFSFQDIIDAIPKVITEGILTEKARGKYLAIE
ncbi:MAG: TetR/AcrR family transcriptional regulator [Bacillota bacterium]